MIRSMTGFGRAREVIGNRDITVEIKSVNHRYCETFIRIPRSYMQIEDLLRNYIQKKIFRGKVEISVNIDRTSDGDYKTVKLNEGILKEYLEILRSASEKYQLTDDISATTLLSFPEVLQKEKEEPDIEALWEDIKTVVDKALDMFFLQREKEGKFLVSDILKKCDEITEHINFITSRSEKLINEYEEKLNLRICEILGDRKIDEQRILTEVAIMADKIAIDEELVRLDSHTKNLKALLCDSAEENKEAVSVGKKTDFIIQEMNREINTVSSKIGDMEVTLHVIEVKTCIEKIREQIQNIE